MALNSDSPVLVTSTYFHDGSVSSIQASVSSGLSNPHPSIIYTSTTDGIAATPSSGSDNPAVLTITRTPTPTAQPDAPFSSQNPGLSQSQIIAAIVLPIVALLLIVPLIILAVYNHRRRRRPRNGPVASELKSFPPSRTRFGWLPAEMRAEVGAARPVPGQMDSQQRPNVIPRRPLALSRGHHRGLDNPVAEDPPPPYAPRVTAMPGAVAVSSSLPTPQLQPATLSETNLVAHNVQQHRSFSSNTETDAVSTISSLDNGEDRGRERDVDEMSFVSAPDQGRPDEQETHQIV